MKSLFIQFTKTKAYFWLKRVFIALFLGQLLYIVLLIWMPVFTTPFIIGQWTKRLGTEKKIYKTWVAEDKISDNMRKAVIASEDQLFNDHFGFDITAIEKAVKYNKRHPKRIRGASTISQQVAKNVFLWQGRSWIRKGLEVYFTLAIELFWSKERILDVYLNIAEMGDGIFGVEAAALHYFGVHANKLTAMQAAAIASVLPNPIQYKVKNPSPYIQKKQRWIVHQMKYIEWDE
jgi:monofunctional glycosyltransferase